MKKFKVIKIEDPYRVIINAGSNNGILLNQQFIVYALDGEELIDPDTKKSLGRLETVKGTGIATFVEDNWCRITSDRKYQPGIGTFMTSENIVATTAKPFELNGSNLSPFENIKIGDLVKNT